MIFRSDDRKSKVGNVGNKLSHGHISCVDWVLHCTRTRTTMNSNLSLLTILLLLVCLVAPSWSKKNYNEAHPHQGLLNSYTAGPFDLELNKKELETLSSGKPVMKQPAPKAGELAGRAICVQDVDAPKEAVWAQILDLDSYKGKVPKLNECKNYSVKKNEDGTFQIKTKMVVGILPGYSVRTFLICCMEGSSVSSLTMDNSLTHKLV